MLVGFAPGGTNDILARVIAHRLSDALGQPVVVDNKPGATGVIATELMVRAAPGGQTLLLGSTGTQTIVPALRPKLPYDPIKDLQPVSLVGNAGLVLAVHPSATREGRQAAPARCLDAKAHARARRRADDLLAGVTG
jgi:tripartite-type tricarboxylate transporter receptor subunit TctC